MIKSGKRMRSVRLSVIIGILICISVFCVFDIVHAENYFLDLQTYNPDLEWTPVEGSLWQEQPSYDYGNVVVGESKTMTLDLYSIGPSPVWVYVMVLNEFPDHHIGSFVGPIPASLGPFSFQINDFVPQEMSVGSHVMTDIFFAPTSLGDHSVYLHIASNDSHGPEGPLVFLHLYGTAVTTAVPEPTTMLLLSLGLIGLAGMKRRMGI